MTSRVIAVLLFVLFCAIGYSQDTTATDSHQANAASPYAVAAAPVATDDTQTTRKKQTSSSRSKKEKPPAQPSGLQPTFMYVAEHCDACAGLMSYLRQAGVVLSITKAQRGNCSAFPTVIYSDGKTDHGERIYQQQVPLPRKLGVQECETGA